ncbi:MAG: hypothetical protein B0D96_11105 [Candidatus Sedimenticola endophacoides]|uniref:Efflux RND transporter periplasmic adaptor subunit n=1 Tax=Candidatus Sedimenticola endophacoides TaxID=2548426 RepID=A0A6N4E4W2_9GAMM|nr:MAG: hypothetical protein B0D94_07285 [Candidatus Sedimenticola endophacoides]OQX33717.1 MAG: hypothetical protein B0D96_11105 [Candidatus Sedimenticola endophacoides]OQX40205.1 MAG: hypothetical protein B0D89_08615 [Candidatus Sedimenticola endophacoides]OQX46991.1 MAG: hypothetical protein B0D86_00795 [Candidatus Sedimenticola endophacoides]PUD98661.1 MAG: efflux RND transporter periplasmic adaptor subunit [Candidatus Sedimenticola endophacoides]
MERNRHNTLPFALAALLFGQCAPAAGTGEAIRALLVARTETVLSSQINGRILTIDAVAGGAIRKGHALVRFDCDLHNAELKKARAQRKAARLRLESNQRLMEHRAVGELELALSETEMQHATADVELWQAQIRRCTIHAPFDGRVVKVLAKPFQSVTLGEPLIEILDDSTYRMELFVPSSWYGRIRPGTRFRVRIDETGRDYPAVVTELGARINPVAQTLGISAEITGDSTDLLAGMSGSALFEDQDGE